jgi:membrane protein DedA with SNARE-associated domain
MVDWWTEVGLATSSFLERHGLLAAFVFLFIEEAGVPVPVPGDVLMLVLGVHAREGIVTLWQAVGVTWVATMLGSSLLYAISRVAGRGVVYRYGRYIRLTPERLDQAEKWLNRHGSLAVFVGRLVPGLRIVTTVACGVFDVRFRVFFPAMAIGSLLYILLYTLLGYYLGPPVLSLLEKVHVPFSLLSSLVPLALLMYWLVRARQALERRPPPQRPAPVERNLLLRAGSAAGLTATIASTLLMNVVINLVGGIAFSAPGTIVEQTAARLAFALARDVQPVTLFVAVPLFVAVGVLWGILYAILAEFRFPPSWPDWQKGFMYALAPLLVSLVVVMPILGLGFLGIGTTGPVALTGEVIRHAAYGVLLGLTYPIFRARRLGRVWPRSASDVPAERPISA